MKLKVEVDLEWIGEEGNIDEEVKSQIISGICSKINKVSQDEIVKKVNDKIAKECDALINQRITEILNEFVSKEIKVTDQWGDVKQEIKIADLLKKRFDSFMTEKVDGEGKASTYGTKYIRMEWIIDKRVRDYCAVKTKEMVVDVENKIKEILSIDLELKVKNKIIENLGLSEILKQKSLTV